jgi:hypothetical protein
VKVNGGRRSLRRSANTGPQCAWALTYVVASGSNGMVPRRKGVECVKGPCDKESICKKTVFRGDMG